VYVVTAVDRASRGRAGCLVGSPPGAASTRRGSWCACRRPTAPTGWHAVLRAPYWRSTSCAGRTAGWPSCSGGERRRHRQVRPVHLPRGPPHRPRPPRLNQHLRQAPTAHTLACYKGGTGSNGTCMDDRLAQLIKKIELLRPSQQLRVAVLVDSFGTDCEIVRNRVSDFTTDEFCREFGDVLRQHHLSSAEPFTKDKFEYAMVKVLNDTGYNATKSAQGYPGHDLTVNGIPWSLKTQADRNLKVGSIHISKFMELGKGRWTDEKDLAALRQRMIDHMRSYDRIFSLRCLDRTPVLSIHRYKYELVEIPKPLLLESQDQPILMQHESKQLPKPGVCPVYDNQTGRLRFALYFDGGTERKLQIRKIDKSLCTVHATWAFTVES
jgi:restriction endonuclease SmaI-like protein